MIRPVSNDGSMRRLLAAVLLPLALAACHGRAPPAAQASLIATATSSTPPPMAITLAPQINEPSFLRTVRTLTSPALGGRKPATRSEVLTTHYLVTELHRMGVLPGYHGRWLQPVPVVSTRLLNTDTRLLVRAPGGVQSFAYGTDMLAGTQQARAQVDLDAAQIVFAGYGIDSPSRDWNDYQHTDVRGKIVIVLDGDPGASDGTVSRHALARAKFALAARQGAVACFIIHPDGSLRTWRALRSAAAGAVQRLPASAAPGPRLAVAGWLTQAAAARLFSAAGASLAAFTQAAAQPNFTPTTLAATGSIRLRSAVEYGWTDNVLGVIRGALHPNQVVIYSAHWDGLGSLPGLRGRRVRLPGAADDATGVAALLQIADAFAHRKRPPARSVLFMLATLGDAGQLGSRYYVEHPVFPLSHTVADINLDLWPILGRARDMTAFGTDASGLHQALTQVLALQGRTLDADPTPAFALAYRSDQYSFARAGVPALLVGPGLDLVSGGRAAGEAAWHEYLRERFNTGADAFNPHWDLSGTLEDIQTLYLLGQDLADGNEWPQWASDSPYRARREAMSPPAPAPSSP